MTHLDFEKEFEEFSGDHAQVLEYLGELEENALPELTETWTETEESE